MHNTISYTRTTFCFRFMKQNYIKLHSKATKLYKRGLFILLFPLNDQLSEFVCRSISINWVVKGKVFTYSKQHSPSWKTNQPLQIVKEFPAFLWNPKFLYRTRKCPKLVPILSQLHPFRTTPSNFLKIHLNIILLNTSGLCNFLFSSGFKNKTLCKCNGTTVPKQAYKGTEFSRNLRLSDFK
jgi:hypothetical protein